MMKAVAKVVKAGQASQPRATKSRALKAVIAPKPMLLKADATPGTQTTAMTFITPACTRAMDGTRSSGATNSSVSTGRNVVANATATKPNVPYMAVPMGAPSANAANIALPTQANTLLVF